MVTLRGPDELLCGRAGLRASDPADGLGCGLTVSYASVCHDFDPAVGGRGGRGAWGVWIVSPRANISTNWPM